MSELILKIEGEWEDDSIYIELRLGDNSYVIVEREIQDDFCECFSEVFSEMIELANGLNLEYSIDDSVWSMALGFGCLDETLLLRKEIE